MTRLLPSPRRVAPTAVPPSLRRMALTAALLLLAGCKPWQPIEARRILAEDSTPIERACLEEARNAPSVRIYDRQVSTAANNFWPQERVDRERRIAENRALADCRELIGYETDAFARLERAA